MGWARVAASVLLGGPLSACSFLLDFDSLEGVATKGSTEAGSAPVRGEPDAGSASDRDGAGANMGAADAAGTTDSTSGSGSPGGDSRDGGWASLDATVPTPGDSLDASPLSDAGGERLDALGPDGSSTCPEACVASNPCVIASCEDGQCKQRTAQGLVRTTFSQVVDGDALYKSELVAAGDRFYRATYGEWDGTADIRLESFQAQGETPLSAFDYSRTLPEGWAVASPAAVAAETRFGGLDLHVYTALRGPNSGAGAPLQTVRIKLDRALTLTGEGPLSLSDTPNFHFRSQQVGPAAGMTPEGEPFAIWNGCTVEGSGDAARCVAIEAVGGRGGLYIQHGNEPLLLGDAGANFLPEHREIIAFAPLTAADARGALWLAAQGVNQSDVRLAFSSDPEGGSLSQCAGPSNVNTGYALDTTRVRNDLWSASWTTRADTVFHTETRGLQCDANGCMDAPPEAGQCAMAADDVKNQVTRTWQREGDPESRVFRAVARTRATTEGSELVLNVDWFDSDTGLGAGATPIGEIVLASADNEEGPDWAAIAPLAPNTLAVSWLEGGGPEQPAKTLQVQTFAVCSGE
jgi:hypothetical protein